MKFFGLEIRRAPDSERTDARPVPRPRWRRAFDWFTGAFQQDVPYDGDDGSTPQPWFNSVTFGCLRLLATDIAKLPPQVVRKESLVWKVVDVHPWTKMLRTPNKFQTWPEFILCWVLSKLTAGNTYVLKLRDSRGMVQELIVLNPFRVQVLVSDKTGNVYYEFLPRSLEGLGETDRVIVAATEIMHDKHLTMFHPLQGMAPLVAASLAASAGRRVLRSYDQLYKAGAVPPGVLTIPDGETDEDIAALAAAWERFRSQGKTAILEEGMKYEPVQAKAIDQQALGLMEWTSKDICIAFGVPPWKLGLEVMPISGNAEIAQQTYYEGSLQWLMEMIEWHMDSGLGMQNDTSFRLDVRALYRLDTNARYLAYTNGIKGGWLAPNEARAAEDLEPVKGGELPYMQQQYWTLEALSKRSTDDLAPLGGNNPSQPARGDGTGEDTGTDDGELGVSTEDDDLQAGAARAAFSRAYAGVWKGGMYAEGTIVSKRGLWHATVPTTSEPGKSPDWKLIVKGK